MTYWACARLEPRREAVAQHFLKLKRGLHPACARTAAQARQAHRNHFTFVPGLRFHRDRAAMAPGTLEHRGRWADHGWRAPGASTRSGYRRHSGARSPRRSRASEVIRAQTWGSRENPGRTISRAPRFTREWNHINGSRYCSRFWAASSGWSCRALMLRRVLPVDVTHRLPQDSVAAEIHKSECITCARWVSPAPRFVAEAGFWLSAQPPRPALIHSTRSVTPTKGPAIRRGGARRFTDLFRRQRRGAVLSWFPRQVLWHADALQQSHRVHGRPCQRWRPVCGCSFHHIAGRHSFGRILPRRSRAAKERRNLSSQPRQPKCEVFASQSPWIVWSKSTRRGGCCSEVPAAFCLRSGCSLCFKSRLLDGGVMRCDPAGDWGNRVREIEGGQ